MENFERKPRKKINIQNRNKMDCGPKYSKVSESLRYATSGSVQCSMFCGGRQCKYEGPAKWGESEMAIKGLYSSWITDSILAMARPSTKIIKKYNIIQQFDRWGITAIINLQHPGEHANCGFGLEKGGFSYNPEDFMDNGIFFYNFIWQDYGVCSLETVLDIVKVMDFALQDGKVSVHCHAGLGRTGVLIACYLIYSLRMSPEQAIHTVRRKRTKSVQTRGQIACVLDFSKFLKPLRIIFPSCYAFGVKQFTLEKYLIHQRHMLHGYEARALKYIPKIIYTSCKRLLDVCKLDSTNLKLTENRLKEKQEEVGEDDVNNGENGLNYQGQSTVTISASMEDLKGEYDDCEISVTDVECNNEIKRYLSNSQPSGLQSLQNRSLLISKPLTKSDSVLCEPHSKQVERELIQHRSQTDNAVFEIAQVKLTKATNAVHSECESKALNDDISKNQENCPELVATAFASDCEKEDEIITKVQTLQHVLNESNEGWDVLEEELNPRVLTALIYSWITTLTTPVLTPNDIQNLGQNSDDPRISLLNLTRTQRGICECLFVTIFKLNGISKELRNKALVKMIIILTQSPSKVKTTTQLTQNTEDVNETETTLSSSIISDCLKYLESLYETFVNDVK